MLHAAYNQGPTARRTVLRYRPRTEERRSAHDARIAAFPRGGENMLYILIVAVVTMLGFAPALAGTAQEIDTAVDGALNELYAANPDAKALSRSAKAILVFPNVV